MHIKVRDRILLTFFSCLSWYLSIQCFLWAHENLLEPLSVRNTKDEKIVGMITLIVPAIYFLILGIYISFNPLNNKMLRNYCDKDPGSIFWEKPIFYLVILNILIPPAVIIGLWSLLPFFMKCVLTAVVVVAFENFLEYMLRLCRVKKYPYIFWKPKHVWTATLNSIDRKSDQHQQNRWFEEGS